MVAQSTINRITNLTQKWYEAISGDHHKTKDCFFYINTVWQFGDPPKYRVEHYGYIEDEIIAEFDTYEKASEFLERTLGRMIREYKEREELD